MDWVIETPRLGLRRLESGDLPALRAFLGDPEVMYAWEHGFSDEEIREWIEKNRSRYAREGYSYFAAIEKESGKLIGVMGPLVETIDGADHVGIAYILARDYWGRGFSAEGARASMEYGFGALGAERVIAEIRPENLASRRVAERLGMKVTGQFVKTVYGKEMPHLIYSREKNEGRLRNE